MSPVLPLAQRHCLQEPSVHCKGARTLLRLELLVDSISKSTSHAGLLSTHHRQRGPGPHVFKALDKMTEAPVEPGLLMGSCTPQKKQKWGQTSPCQEKPHLGHHVLPEAVTGHRQLHYSCLLCGSAGVGGTGACAKGLSADLGMDVTGRGTHGSKAAVILGAGSAHGSAAHPPTCMLPTKPVPRVPLPTFQTHQQIHTAAI